MTKYSNHAREKMIEKGISVNEVEESIKLRAKEFHKLLVDIRDKFNDILTDFDFFPIF